MISSGSGLSIYDRRRDNDRRRVIKGARTSDNRDKVVKISRKEAVYRSQHVRKTTGRATFLVSGEKRCFVHGRVWWFLQAFVL